MSKTIDKSRESIGGGTHDEENDHSAQPNIALMFELKEREIERKTRRARTAVLIFSAAVLLAVVGYLWVRYATPQDEPRASGHGNSAPPVVSAREVREDGVKNVPHKVIAVSGVADKELQVGLYDFDANHFLIGREVVDHQEELQGLLEERGAELKSSSIVIFAGASFDGDPGDNRKLCLRRGCYVGKLALKIPGVSQDQLWVIAAGEHKFPGPPVPDEEQKEDDVRSSPNGEQILRGQRKLLLVTIPSDAGTGVAAGDASALVKAVVEVLRRNNFLPTDYDHGQWEPTPFAEVKCDQITLLRVNWRDKTHA